MRVGEGERVFGGPAFTRKCWAGPHSLGAARPSRPGGFVSPLRGFEEFSVLASVASLCSTTAIHVWPLRGGLAFRGSISKERRYDKTGTVLLRDPGFTNAASYLRGG